MQETDLLKLEKVSTLSLLLYIIALRFILARSSNRARHVPFLQVPYPFIPVSLQTRERSQIHEHPQRTEKLRC